MIANSKAILKRRGFVDRTPSKKKSTGFRRSSREYPVPSGELKTQPIRFPRAQRKLKPRAPRDVVKAVSDLCRDEDHAASRNFAVLGSRLEAGLAADHVIDFVFAMRLLPVRSSAGRT